MLHSQIRVDKSKLQSAINQRHRNSLVSKIDFKCPQLIRALTEAGNVSEKNGGPFLGIENVLQFDGFGTNQYVTSILTNWKF